MSGYGGMSTSSSKNQSQNQSKFNEDVWAQQAPYLQQLYGTANQVFQNAYGGMLPEIYGANAWAKDIGKQAIPGWQQQMAGGAYSGLNANDVYQTLYQAMGSPTATQEINNMIMGGKGNNYADAMKEQYISDANRATQNMLNNLDARASVSGLPGSSRQGIASGIGMEDINRNLQRNMAETGFHTFDKDLDRKLAIAAQADQGNLMRQQMLVDMLGGKQSAMSGGLNATGSMAGLGGAGLDYLMLPFQALGAYANTIGGPTVLGSGSSLGQARGSSSAFGMQGGGGIGGNKGGK